MCPNARVRPLRWLLAASLACAVFYVGWLLAADPWTSAAWFALVGAAAAPMYPIASAQAYAALPGRTGTVNAAAHLFTPLTLAIPWALGVIADEVGLAWALAALLVQPLGLIVVVGVASRTDR